MREAVTDTIGYRFDDGNVKDMKACGSRGFTLEVAPTFEYIALLKSVLMSVGISVAAVSIIQFLISKHPVWFAAFMTGLVLTLIGSFFVGFL